MCGASSSLGVVLANYTYSDAKLSVSGLEGLMEEFPGKMVWFVSKGYAPH